MWRLGRLSNQHSTIIATGCGRSGPYEYMDAVTLLEDFWKEVDEVLRERGSLP